MLQCFDIALFNVVILNSECSIFYIVLLAVALVGVAIDVVSIFNVALF